jgi:hypothetical protein
MPYVGSNSEEYVVAQHFDLPAQGTVYRPGLRLVARMVRVYGRDDNGEWLVADGNAVTDEPSSIGYRNDAAVWYPSYDADPSGQVRNKALWANAYPGLTEPTPDTPTTGTTQSAAPDPYHSRVRSPIFARPAFWQDPGTRDWARDTGLLPQRVAVAGNRPLPGDAPVLLVPFSTTGEQQMAAFSASSDLIAVWHGGNGSYGTWVYDVTPQGNLDQKRKARFHSLARVYRYPSLKTTTGGSAPGGLCWILGADVDGQGGLGVIADKPAAGSSVPKQTPTGGAATTTGGSGGSTTEKTTSPIESNRQTDTPPTPEQATGSVPKTQAKPPAPTLPPVALGYSTWTQYGPFFVGFDDDQHRIATTPDGENVNSTHLWEGALFAGDTGDAPLKFDPAPWARVGKGGPLVLEVFCRNDKGDSHKWIEGFGPRAGLRKWQVAIPIDVPKGPNDDGNGKDPNDDNGKTAAQEGGGKPPEIEPGQKPPGKESGRKLPQKESGRKSPASEPSIFKVPNSDHPTRPKTPADERVIIDGGGGGSVLKVPGIEIVIPPGSNGGGITKGIGSESGVVQDGPTGVTEGPGTGFGTGPPGTPVPGLPGFVYGPDGQTVIPGSPENPLTFEPGDGFTFGGGIIYDGNSPVTAGAVDQFGPATIETDRTYARTPLEIAGPGFLGRPTKVRGPDLRGRGGLLTPAQQGAYDGPTPITGSISAVADQSTGSFVWFPSASDGASLYLGGSTNAGGFALAPPNVDPVAQQGLGTAPTIEMPETGFLATTFASFFGISDVTLGGLPKDGYTWGRGSNTTCSMDWYDSNGGTGEAGVGALPPALFFDSGQSPVDPPPACQVWGGQVVTVNNTTNGQAAAGTVFVADGTNTAPGGTWQALPTSGGGWGGDGTDGAAVFNSGSVYNQTADVFYTAAHISNSSTVFTNGFRFFVQGTLTIDAGSIMDNSGGPAVGVTGGAGAVSGTLAPGANGANGAAAVHGTTVNGTAGSNASNSFAGHGGAGGNQTLTPATTGGAGGTATNPGATFGRPDGLPFAVLGFVDGFGGASFVNGGGGGGSGAAANQLTAGTVTSGGGGGGGGVMVVACGTLVNNGTIRANGGNGGQGTGNATGGGTGFGAGGGGGGGGGEINLVYGASGSTLGTVQVNGGTGGAAYDPGSQGLYSPGAAGATGKKVILAL